MLVSTINIHVHLRMALFVHCSSSPFIYLFIYFLDVSFPSSVAFLFFFNTLLIFFLFFVFFIFIIYLFILFWVVCNIFGFNRA